MLSLLAVFKDILPGYRIRLPTEKELEIPVSKEVKQTRDYESMQVRLYQVSKSCSQHVIRIMAAYTASFQRVYVHMSRLVVYMHITCTSVHGIILTTVLHCNNRVDVGDR